MKEPETSIVGWIILQSAKTLQERAFARLIYSIEGRAIKFGEQATSFEIYPNAATAAGLLQSCAAHAGIRETLMKLPLCRPPRSARADPELVPTLQDLAEIVAWEATEAFKAAYYPGLPDVFVPEEHVPVVMAALQRELDREGKSRQKVPVTFTSLPPERQRALAERRRFWYRKFGITPERWSTGTWSLWDVQQEAPPACVQ